MRVRGLSSSVVMPSGITFAEAAADGETFEVEGRAIPIIGRSALIKNKRAAGRDQDLVDVNVLEGE
jgi:hypothetical protein